MINSIIIKGNLKQLPDVSKRGGKDVSSAFRSWVIGDIGEVIGFWVLHKARFWRIVKPLLLQHRDKGKIKNISSFISPDQIRQGLCYLPSADERYYKSRVLTEKQIKLTQRWDFLALKIQKEGKKTKSYPCLIDVKTQKFEVGSTEDYRLFKKRDFSKEKKLGFRVFVLKSY